MTRARGTCEQTKGVFSFRASERGAFRTCEEISVEKLRESPEVSRMTEYEPVQKRILFKKKPSQKETTHQTWHRARQHKKFGPPGKLTIV